jgi:hypothetical protein
MAHNSYRRWAACCAQISSVLFGLLILLGTAAADEMPLTLAGGAPSSGGEITISVPDAGVTYPLTFLAKAGHHPSNINLSTSSFIGTQGDAIQIKIRLPGDMKDQPAETRQDVPLAGQLLEPALVIPPLPHSGSYQGMLIVTTPANDAMVVKITLEHPPLVRAATLVVDPQSPPKMQVAQRIARRSKSWGLPSSSADADFSLTLRDKGGSSPMEGIYPLLESVAKAPDGQFAIGRNLTFTFNGVPVWGDLNKGKIADAADPDSLPTNIPAGGHAIVGIHLQNLATGEYDVTLRFRAANSTDDDAQKFHFVADVHVPLIAALAAVLSALLFSFVGTKIVGFKKKRLDLQQRIGALNTFWLKDEPPLVPVVCARVMLNQCDESSRRFWLSGAM